MHFNWNKRVLASSFAVLSIMATSLTAIPKGPCDRKEDICCENPKPGPFAFAYPLDLGLNCPRDFYVHVDGLAFQAKQDGMDFAIEDNTSTTPGTPTAPISYGKLVGFSSENSSWHWNPGIRFGLGFFLDHDAWNIDFNWTWVNITSSKREHATGAAVLIPLFALGSGDVAGTPSLFGPNAGAVWKANYNTIDLSLGKPYYVSRYFILDPYFGIRGAWIDQHFSVDYGGSSMATRTIHHGENQFWGIGLRSGINSEWIVGKGWCLFANLSAAMMASKFEIEQDLAMAAGTSDPSGDGFSIKNDFYQNVPNMEMSVGIAWSKYFNREQYRIGLKAAYEFIEWWDQFNMRKFFSGTPGYANDTVSRGNLTLNGFSLKVQVDI